MDETSETVQALIDRFSLRRRAETAEFLAGVQLVRSGCVTITEVTELKLRASVSDHGLLEVTVLAHDGDGLVGRCACEMADHGVCRHQVAVTHALWMHREAARHVEGQ